MKMRCLFVRSALIIFFLSMATGSHAQSVFGTCEIDSWNACSSNLAAFCQVVGLPFALTGMDKVAGTVLRAPHLAGVQVQRPIRLYLLLGSGTKSTTPSSVAALPLIDNGTAYLASLRNTFQTITTNASISLFSNPDEPRTPAEHLAVLITNQVALVGETAEDVAALALALRTNGVPVFEKLSADLRIGLDMARLAPLLEQGSKVMRHQMAQQPMPNQPGQPEPAKLVGSELDAALAIARQIRQISLGVKVDGANATLLIRVDPISGSILAAAMQETRPPSERYTRLLPANALFGVAGGGLTAANVLIKPYANFIVQFYKGIPGMADKGIAVRDLLLQSTALYTGDYALEIQSDNRANGVFFAEIIAVSDADQARKGIRNNIALATQAETNAPLGFCTVALPDRAYAGAEIQSYSYRTQTHSMDPMEQRLMPAAMILSFLTNCTFEQTVVGKDLLVTVGRAGAMDQLIDRVKQGGDSQFYDTTRSLFSDTAQQPTEVSRLDLSAAISTLLPMLPGDFGNRMPQLPPGRGLGTLTMRQDHSMLMMMRISTPEVRSLVQAVSVMMMPPPRSLPAGMNHPSGMPAAPSSDPHGF